MTQSELVDFLKENLQLEIKETKPPFDSTNCKRIEIVLSLKTPGKVHVLAADSFKVYEDLR